MAASLGQKKIKEGLLYLKEAEKCLQTSWLKWKPDFDSAADKFTKAATAFKVAKSYEQAKDAFLKAANAHSKNNSLYHEGKALEQAAGMLKEMNKIEEAAQLLQGAGSLYHEHGTPDTAALVWIKAAKMCEGKSPNKAVELYRLAGDLREMDDKLREAAEPYGKVTQLLIKQQKFEEAVKSLQKQLELYAKIGNSAMQFKVILGLTVVFLSQSDFVAADKCFKDGFEVGGFGNSDEAEAIEELLKAYDESDGEKIKTIVTKPLFRNLDNELSKLARDLKPSEEFNINQQHTELRLLSTDISSLHIDDTKSGDGKSGQTLDFEDEEENPLGSAEGEQGIGTSVHQKEIEDKHLPLPKVSSSSRESERTLNTADLIQSSEKIENTVGSSPHNNDQELEDTHEDDDFENGLC